VLALQALAAMVSDEINNAPNAKNVVDLRNKYAEIAAVLVSINAPIISEKDAAVAVVRDQGTLATNEVLCSLQKLHVASDNALYVNHDWSAAGQVIRDVIGNQDDLATDSQVFAQSLIEAIHNLPDHYKLLLLHEVERYAGALKVDPLVASTFSFAPTYGKLLDCIVAEALMARIDTEL